MNTQILISIGIYMVGMLLIGYFAYKRTSNLSDYMIGGRGLGAAVTALSAGASDMSGWLLMGLPGAMFTQGLSASWIAIGLTIGAYLNWLYVAPRLRIYTETANNSMTIPAYLENRFGDHSSMLRLTSGLVIIVFFTFYVSSGMVSGGVLFESTFNLNYQAGLWIIAAVVIGYTLFGGFLAVSWTDFVQGIIMVIALVLVPAVTIMQVGGFDSAFGEIKAIDPKLFDIFKGTSLLGIISLMAWGLGYFGQPHIIVRFMAISSVKEIKKARRIGMGWMIFSVGGAMFTGFIGLAYYSKQGLNLADPETIFIKLSEILFHPLITGFLLAALLAAVMSTISSQLLVTASSLTEDVYKTFFRRSATDKELLLVSRLSVLVVSFIAVFLAFNKNGTILSLVAYAWAGFGAAFGPVILLSLYWKRMNRWGALAGMIGGAVTVIVWANVPVLAKSLYEIIPGFIIGLAAIWVVSLVTPEPSDQLKKEFDQYKQSA
ncbi:sodium/proline symporter PutP [Bacillus sp. AFS076308]|uniref:sodium/proline symporter PutP n=1 Tax=unclassified Bacillus (in: firmicutes) TaxID=185979 RepID=UPI000BF7FF24|nr:MULTISPECIES: sodium/proline symporter PutP [unclassified Bacillus (in: firmicutes)]PFO08663.1 sodium/proline symporter PutP [Bacillus sp. AFS076308]PGV49912.1 sodium/proline symporter PutP [Bacillus sp. AFS037270]